MGFDPNQFTMQLVQSLGQQVQQGLAQGREQKALGPILEQLQGGSQDPQEILNAILQLQANQDIRPATQQRLAGLAPQFSQLAKTQTGDVKEEKQRNAAAQELSRLTGRPVEQFQDLPLTTLNSSINAQLVGEKTVAAETGKSNVKLANEIRAGSRKAQNRLGVIDQLGELGAKGETGPVNARRFFGLFGAPDIGETPTQGAITAARSFLLDFVKETFGGRLNQTEVEIINKAIPDVNDKPEVFKAKLAIWQKMIQKASVGGDIINNIIAQSGGKVPSDQDIGFLYDQQIGQAKNEIFSDIESLGQSESQVSDQAQQGLGQPGDILSNPAVSEIVQQLRSQGIPDEEIRRGLLGQ